MITPQADVPFSHGFTKSFVWLVSRVLELIQLRCRQATIMTLYTLKAMPERNAGREMVGTVLELHWENENKKTKKTGETGFLSRAVI